MTVSNQVWDWGMAVMVVGGAISTQEKPTNFFFQYRFIKRLSRSALRGEAFQLAVKGKSLLGVGYKIIKP